MPNTNESKEPSRTERPSKVLPTKPPTLKKQGTPLASHKSSKKESMTPGRDLAVGPAPEVGFLLEESNIFEYAIGIRDISVRGDVFQESGVFVSKPMQVEGNILEVEMEAVEEHPLFDGVSGRAAERRTSVEYYITGSEKPTPDDWMPILPKGEMSVRSEKLFMTNGGAKLRFMADITSVIVYQDGVRMDDSEYVVTEQGHAVFIENTKSGSLYTADYSPRKDSGAWTLDVSKTPGAKQRMVERFQGASHNKTVKLSKYPFIDWAKLNAGEAYEPFEVRLKDANIIGSKGVTYREIGTEKEGGEPFTRDKTSYLDGRWVELQSYEPKEGGYKGFDYYNHKDKLVFSETFAHADILNEMDDERLSHGRADIEVSYEYLSTSFRLKIILRRNSEEEDMVSPSVKRYQIRFKTMK